MAKDFISKITMTPLNIKVLIIEHMKIKLCLKQVSEMFIKLFLPIWCYNLYINTVGHFFHYQRACQVKVQCQLQVRVHAVSQVEAVMIQ